MSQMKTFFGSTAGLIASLILAALGAYLLAYHLVHVALVVPYLFLLACPLMHFMHRGHHHHHGSGTDNADKGSPPNRT